MNALNLSYSMGEAFDWTWKTSLQASVLMLLVLSLQAFLGRWLTAKWRYALSLLVLVRLLLPAVPSSEFSIFNLGKTLSLKPSSSSPLQLHGIAATSPMPDTSLRRPSESISSDSNLVSIASVAVESNLDFAIPRPIEFTATTIRNSKTDTRAAVNYSTASPWIWALGSALILLTTLERHRRFAKWVGMQTSVTDGRIVAVFEECKETMQVTAPLAIREAGQLNTPALFGFWKPCLLLPAQILDRLNERELRLVLMHELAHLKRRDILLNWLIIFVRAWHWFNPLVWVAMKRLRSDRELVCDDLVLARLIPDQRHLYGNVLIKLANDLSSVRLCPSLVPVINRKSEIERRITMIASPKPSSRLIWMLFATVFITLCTFALPRAVDPHSASVSEKDAQAKSATIARQQEQERGMRSRLEEIANLRDELTSLAQKIQFQQDRLDRLAKDLDIPPDIAAEKSHSIVDPETTRNLESERITALSKQSELGALLKLLSEKNRDERLKAIPVAYPDALLSELLQRRSQTAQDLEALKTQSGNEVQIKRDEQIQKTIEKQIDERLSGVISGLEIQGKAYVARVDFLSRELQSVRQRDRETLVTYHPYFQVKHELENLQKVKDALHLKLIEDESTRSLLGLRILTPR